MTNHRLTRRSFLQTAAAGAALAAPGIADAKTGKRPNLLVIVSDQQHGDALGFKDPFFSTPHLDRFAAESVVFDNAFCSTPQCSPSRSSLMTGLYPHKTGVLGNTGTPDSKDLELKNIGSELQDLGYRTAYYGKWHLGKHPTGNAGWDEAALNIGDDKVTEKGIQYLSSAADAAEDEKPFALFLMFVDPHDIYDYKPDQPRPGGTEIPLQESWSQQDFSQKPVVQKQFMTEDQGTKLFGRDQAAWEGYRDFYRGKVGLIDDAFGSLHRTLREKGLAEKTAVVFQSDHGDMDASHRLIFKGPFMYENMVNVPLIVNLPRAFGGAGHRRSNFLTANVDFAPTLLDLAGGDLDCDGVSLKPVLTGEERDRDFVISQYYGKQKWINPIRMIRTHDWKYNVYIRHGEELYDLENDPGEIVNLADDPAYKKTKRDLRAALDGWIAENDDPFYSMVSTDRGGVPL